jgi:AcrR family transcriptional regulator
MTLSPQGTGESVPWRDRAIRRSLEPARARSDARLQRLLDAARQIIRDSPDSDLTVGEAAARSGISLKTLYQWFASKDDLLLALIEEECQMGAAMLSQIVDSVSSPSDRLRRCAEGMFEMAENAPEYARVLYRQHQRLSVDHRVELAAAVAPLVRVIEAEIQRAQEAGVADPGDPARSAEIVFSLLIDGLAVFTARSGVDSETAASLWRFIAGGLGLRLETTSSRKEHFHDGH